jgi:hypothetical protein
MVSVEQAHRLVAAVDQFPEARWIIALHHHLMEYPMSVSVFSERVGTALINGNWFVRRLRSFAARAIVIHGHRRLDRRLRRAENHLGPVAGDGREERRVDLFPYPHPGVRPGRAALFASAGARVEVAGVNEPDHS